MGTFDGVSGNCMRQNELAATPVYTVSRSHTCQWLMPNAGCVLMPSLEWHVRG